MADKIYCYPDTGILKNRMNIHDAGRFSEAEIRFVSIRLYQLYANPISGSFDFAHLCRIHHHIFQDLYGWARQFKTEHPEDACASSENGGSSVLSSISI